METYNQNLPYMENELYSYNLFKGGNVIVYETNNIQYIYINNGAKKPPIKLENFLNSEQKIPFLDKIKNTIKQLHENYKKEIKDDFQREFEELYEKQKENEKQKELKQRQLEFKKRQKIKKEENLKIKLEEENLKIKLEEEKSKLENKKLKLEEEKIKLKLEEEKLKLEEKQLKLEEEKLEQLKEKDKIDEIELVLDFIELNLIIPEKLNKELKHIKLPDLYINILKLYMSLGIKEEYLNLDIINEYSSTVWIDTNIIEEKQCGPKYILKYIVYNSEFNSNNINLLLKEKIKNNILAEFIYKLCNNSYIIKKLLDERHITEDIKSLINYVVNLLNH